MKNMMTYAAAELEPLGFSLLYQSDRATVWKYGYIKLLFECACPTHPGTLALGCPVHHMPSDVGGSWPVDEAKKIAEVISLGPRTAHPFPKTEPAAFPLLG